jgi:tripartite-type tricarboxylate transporter receptor subunit TctC
MAGHAAISRAALLLTASLFAACAIGNVMGVSAVRAEDAPYPARIVKLIVAFAPGSTTDILARLVADQLATTWSQTVVVENISGAAGHIGTTQVANAAPDGYTLLVTPAGQLVTHKMLYKDMPYDPQQFVPITLLAKVPNVLTVLNDPDMTTLAAVVAKAKAAPGKLTYASQGVGSTAHLTSKLLEAMAGISMVHVPYRGAGPALNDVIGGHVDMFFDTLTTSGPIHKGGKAHIVGVASLQRAKSLPDVPAIAELYPGFQSITWFALMAPPHTPEPLAECLNRDVAAILAKPDVKSKLDALALDPGGGSRAETAQFIAGELELWSKVIKRANVTLQ